MTKIEEYLKQNKETFKPWLEDGEQGRIEIKILPYLKDIENGFFVEAGALDGLFMSNTKILEDLGWDGLLVEPSEKAVDKCRLNRISLVEHCALVSRDYPYEKAVGDFFFDGSNGEGAWSGLHRSAYGIKAAMAVPARTLESVLTQHGITKIDFLSLDVEGYELEVLRGINFEQVAIRYLLVEVNLDAYSMETLNTYLSQFGFKSIACLSGFTKDTEGWNGLHNDYLYKK